MLTWTFLHIATMFLAVGVALGSDLMLHRIARSGDVRAIRTAFRLAKPLSLLVPALFVLGLLFGLVTIAVGGIGFFQLWLILSYVVFAVAMVAGGALFGPWAEKVLKASDVSADDAPSAELQTLVHDRKAIAATLIVTLAVIIVAYLMVMKPT